MLNKEKHRQIMLNILDDIFKSDFGKNLAFKGGTACYLLYSLDRFSTDLDFDLLQEVENLDEKLIKILNKYGEVKKLQKRMILSYGKRDYNIKIDLNRNIWENNKYEIVSLLATDIKIQDKATIFANKLVCLLERDTNRDIYDVFYFIKNYWDVNEDLIFERTGMNLKDVYSQIVSKLKKLSKNYKILDELGEVLEEKQKIFVKNRLIIELISQLEMKIKF